MAKSLMRKPTVPAVPASRRRKRMRPERSSERAREEPAEQHQGKRPPRSASAGRCRRARRGRRRRPGPARRVARSPRPRLRSPSALLRLPGELARTDRVEQGDAGALRAAALAPQPHPAGTVTGSRAGGRGGEPTARLQPLVQRAVLVPGPGPPPAARVGAALHAGRLATVARLRRPLAPKLASGRHPLPAPLAPARPVARRTPRSLGPVVLRRAAHPAGSSNRPSRAQGRSVELAP